MLKFLDKHCSNLKETNQIPIIFQTINETGGFGYEKLVLSGTLNIAGASNSLKLSRERKSNYLITFLFLKILIEIIIILLLMVQQREILIQWVKSVSALAVHIMDGVQRGIVLIQDLTDQLVVSAAV